MGELSEHDKSFTKKLEKMKKDLEGLNRPDAVEKINELIKMIGDGCDQTQRSHAMGEAFGVYTEAMLGKIEQLKRKAGINLETK
jgi:hypothetical protein